MTNFTSKDRVDSQYHIALKVTHIGCSSKKLCRMKEVLGLLRRACYINCIHYQNCLRRLELRSNTSGHPDLNLQKRVKATIVYICTLPTWQSHARARVHWRNARCKISKDMWRHCYDQLALVPCQTLKPWLSLPTLWPSHSWKWSKKIIASSRLANWRSVRLNPSSNQTKTPSVF